MNSPGSVPHGGDDGAPPNPVGEAATTRRDGGPVSLEFETGPDDDLERVRIEARSWGDLASAAASRRLEGFTLHEEHLTSGGGLRGCLVCGHPELFVQRDFPRAFGIAIVVVAAILAPFTYYLSLIVASAIDLVLYHTARRMTVCYVCTARHRGFAEEPRHPAFDREIGERLKFGPKAVMGKPMRPGGTAGAPDPEH